MGPPKPVCRDIIGAEERFAQTVKNFIGSYDPKLQPFVSRIAAGWAKQWSTMISPTLFPPAGDGLDEFMQKLHHQYFYKAYYSVHRERILQRNRESYRRRKRQWRQPPTDA